MKILIFVFFIHSFQSVEEIPQQVKELLIQKYSHLFDKFIGVIEAQIKEIDQEYSLSSDSEEENSTQAKLDQMFDVQRTPIILGLKPRKVFLNDIDESKQYPMKELIKSLLGKIIRPSQEIKRVVLTKQKQRNLERKLQGNESELHQLIDQVVKNGQYKELMNFLKQEVQQKKNQQTNKRKLKLKNMNIPYEINPMRIVNEVLQDEPLF